MFQGFTPRRFPLALAAAAMTLAACADPTSAPRSLAADAASRTLGPLQSIPAGSTVININSSAASTQYCGGLAGNIAPSGPGAFAGPCGASFDLTAALTVYNPGWPATPHVGSAWLGPQADANLYRVLPGSYLFRTTFNVPAGATSPLLNLSSLADNVAIVYLNGHEVGRNSPTQDCPDAGNCNWLAAQTLTMFDNTAGDFVIGGTNTLDIILVDTPIGLGTSHGCSAGPQASSPLPDKLPANGGTWNVTECRNPSAINFWGTVSFTPQAPPRAVALFVIGDVEAHAIGDNVNFWGAQWWKNNEMSGEVSNGVASFKGYATQSDNVCGGTWVSKPGNSSNPPDVIPDDVAIIVTSKVIKKGNDISGDIKQIVIVHHDGGYGPNPGHRGNGPVTTVVCTQ